MPRNRPLTESRIREAALRILRRDGFEGWGVNHVAREANVDKVLLYRYFKGLDGLLSEILRSTRFWPDPDTLPKHSPEAWIEATLLHQQNHPEGHLFLASPEARTPVSHIRRKYNTEVDRWLNGFLAETTGFISREQKETLPAQILYQSSTGQENLTTHEIWLLVSPPLHWHKGRFENSEPDELPPEML